jgi:hypothetical protein
MSSKKGTYMQELSDVRAISIKGQKILESLPGKSGEATVEGILDTGFDGFLPPEWVMVKRTR